MKSIRLRDWLKRYLTRKLLIPSFVWVLFIVFVDFYSALVGNISEIQSKNIHFVRSQTRNLQFFEYGRTLEDLNVFATQLKADFIEVRDRFGSRIGGFSSKTMVPDIGSMPKGLVRVGFTPYYISREAIRGATGEALGVVTVGVSLFKWISFAALKTVMLLSLSLFVFFRLRKGMNRASHMLWGPVEGITAQFTAISNASNLEQINFEPPNNSKTSKNLKEFQDLEKSFQLLLLRLKRAEQEKMEFAKRQALAEMAAQVAHDIRSPLTALNVISKSIDTLPVGFGEMLVTSIRRISNIADDLLAKTRKDKNPNFSQICILNSVLTDIVYEKKIEFSHRSGVEFNLINTSKKPLFIKVPKSDLERIVSNLLNNAIESIVDDGIIEIHFSRIEERVEIVVTDSGRGIPNEILSKVGKIGFTHGKSNGNGIGLSNAIEKLKSWGGDFKIGPRIDGFQGTSVIITLPSYIHSDVFKTEIKLNHNGWIIIFDDDDSILNRWRSYFESLATDGTIEVPTILMTKNMGEFERFFQTVVLDKTTVLIDFDLGQNEWNGFELLMKYQPPNGALVTNSFGDEDLIQKCIDAGIKIIPKALISQVTISK